MTPEGKVKQRIDAWIKVNMPGAWRYRAPGGPFGKNGVGDFIIIWNFTPIMIEAKADETCDATDLQKKQLREFAQAGGISCLLKGFQEYKLERIKCLCINRRYAVTTFESAGLEIS
jgi:hypothetical protein